MTADQVARLQDAAPFRPHLIQLADGRSLYIKHPDFVSVSDEEQLIYVYELPDNVEIIDLLLVISLRYGSTLLLPRQ